MKRNRKIESNAIAERDEKAFPISANQNGLSDELINSLSRRLFNPICHY